MTSLLRRLGLTGLCGLAVLLVVLHSHLGMSSRQSDIEEIILSSQEREEAKASEADRNTILRSLAKKPLGTLPLFAFGLIEEDRSEAAFDEAVRRNPRVLSARMIRVQQLIAAEDYNAAVEQLMALININQKKQDDYFQILAELSTRPGAQPALLSMLEKDYRWLPRFMRVLNENSQDIQFLYRANRFVPKQQESFLRRLIDSQQYELALIAWLEYNSVDLSELNWPFNPTFAQRRETPPFNWQLHHNQVEYSNSGGIHVVHLSRQIRHFASQLMSLGPGAYQLKAETQGTIIPGSGDISIRVSCVADYDPLVILPLGRSVSPDAGSFIIPPDNCKFQELLLLGGIGQFPRISRLSINNVRIKTVENVTISEQQETAQ